MITSRIQQGFSLVETLVAITILLLVVVGPMQILKQSADSTRYASEQTIAYYLAQEGIELVEKQRDDLLLSYFRGEFGLAGWSNSTPMDAMDAGGSNNPLRRCFTSSGCGLYMQNDGTLGSVGQSCWTNGVNCQLYEGGTGGAWYTYTNTGALSPFIRRISIEAIPDGTNPEEFKVTSRVQWRTGSFIAGQQVELVTYLENIYDTN